MGSMLHTAMISSGDLGKESVVGIRTRDYQKKEKKKIMLRTVKIKRVEVIPKNR